MPASIRQFSIGKARVSVINIGDIHLPFAQYLNIPETEHHRHSLKTQTRAPIHATHIQLPDMSLLVDAGFYDIENYSNYALPDYIAPPSLVKQLASIDIQPESIQHVILTHRHWDHINGTTCRKNGEYVPQFPDANYYLGEQDWIRSEANRNDPSEVEYHTLRILDEHNHLQLISEKTNIGEHIQIIPAPGETQGHQVVRVHSEGEIFYCLGDIYHHPLEFANINWMVSWARPETTLASREMLLNDIVEHNAILVATHIPDIGRLMQTGDGLDRASVTIERLKFEAAPSKVPDAEPEEHDKL